MQTFWGQGYAGTSIRDLVEVCGLTTRSMYDSFGGKEQLFERALEHYETQVVSRVVTLLQGERGLSALYAFVAMLTENGTSDGCLYFNTGAERHRVAKQSVRRVERFRSSSGFRGASPAAHSS